MPTILPPRRATEPPPARDRGLRDVFVAAALLLSVLGLICEKILPPTPGYSLARSAGDLQLSP